MPLPPDKNKTPKEIELVYTTGPLYEVGIFILLSDHQSNVVVELACVGLCVVVDPGRMLYVRL